VEIDAELNQTVESARFVGAEGDVAECERPGPDRVRVVWSEPVSGSYSFALTNGDGWTNRRPVRYTLKVVADAPPEVRLELPDIGESITPTAELPARLSFEDTYGLAAVKLFVRRNDEPAFDVPLEGFAPGQREAAIETIVDVASFGVVPGERLAAWAQASDRDPRGPNVGRSELVELRVVTPADFLAELAARELELRREFERLVSAQRGLSDAVGRLLPDLPSAGSTPPALAQRLAGLARRQDTHARTCLDFRRRFLQMLAQMRANKVARAGDERRIEQRIAAPLERLGAEAMPQSSAILAGLREVPDRAGADALPDRQAEILDQMRDILANMLEWEGYREAVALLREIIEAQSDIRAGTAQALERQVEQILGLEEPPESQPAETPKP
jgi:hypothetical protein